MRKQGPMNKFEQFAYHEICRALTTIDASTIPDLYVISFFINDEDDDPRLPVLQIGYNTLKQLSDSIAFTSSDEAKWNFAFWLQNELAFIGQPGSEGAQLLEAYLQEQGLWYSDDDEDDDFDRCMQIGSEITAYFVDACVRIARSLHDKGFVVAQFSRPLPIIVHELEYYDAIAVQTRTANPPGLAQEFEDWIASLHPHH